jgi:AraC-like DNA-binding protein
MLPPDLMQKSTVLRPLRRPARDACELERWLSYRDGWLSKLAAGAHFLQLFDCIPGVAFFAKDREGRLLFASKGLLARYGMESEHEILGYKDHDINPVSMADAYVSDDRRLLSGDAEKLERMELWWDLQGLPDWHLVTKVPVRDSAGECVGVAGILREPEEAERLLPVFQTVAKAVEVIRRDYAKPLRIEEVAQACGQSIRQLQRRFQSAFGLTPQEFLIKTRVLAATRLLENRGISVAQVAEASGFADQNLFAQHFSRRTGLSPAAYRRRLVGAPVPV